VNNFGLQEFLMLSALHINLAPPDLPIATHLTPHQIEAFQDQVSEIVLTVETRPGRGYFAAGWHENVRPLHDLLKELCRNYANCRVVEIDYTQQARQDVANNFFGGIIPPLKDFRGGPLYSYFYGMFRAGADYILHLDSDMFIGGYDPNWIKEAIHILETRDDVLACSPLPGPPTRDGHLRFAAMKENPGARIYEFDNFSTRVFFVDRRKFASLPIQLGRPSLKGCLTSIIDRNPLAECPEVAITRLMQHNKLKRVDFGKIWSLHPPYKGRKFASELPVLIQRIKNEDVPESQRGFYDIVDDFFDCSEVRAQWASQRRWRRLAGRFIDRFHSPFVAGATGRDRDESVS
jgi:hypothetical protein